MHGGHYKAIAQHYQSRHLSTIANNYLSGNATLNDKTASLLTQFDQDALQIITLAQCLNTKDKQYTYQEVKSLLRTKVDSALKEEVHDMYPGFASQFKWRPHHQWEYMPDGTIGISTAHLLSIIRDQNSTEWGNLGHEITHAQKNHRALKQNYIHKMNLYGWIAPFFGYTKEGVFFLSRTLEREADAGVSDKYAHDMEIYHENRNNYLKSFNLTVASTHPPHKERARFFFDKPYTLKAPGKVQKMLGMTDQDRAFNAPPKAKWFLGI